jgi:hypothetical protein
LHKIIPWQRFIDKLACYYNDKKGRIGTSIRTVIAVLIIAKIINHDSMLIDSTVLLNNIIYPTDIGLIFKALKKMKQVANRCHIPVWWDEQEVKQLWREYNLNRKDIEIAHFFLILY